MKINSLNIQKHEYLIRTIRTKLLRVPRWEEGCLEITLTVPLRKKIKFLINMFFESSLAAWRSQSFVHMII